MKKLSFLIVIVTIGFFSNLSAATLPIFNNANEDSVSDNIIVNANVEKELFPVIAELISRGNAKLNLPELVKWNIQNKNSNPVTLSIIADIPEWTEAVISNVNLKAGEIITITQTPFGKKLLNNNNSLPTTVELKVKNEGEVIFEETRNIDIRAYNDMIWSLNSSYDLVSLIAAWVTPNDPIIEEILSKATSGLFRTQLSGYINTNPNGVKKQVNAIFNAVRKYNVGFVNSSVTFGEVGLLTQRVRLPRESIMGKSANCIDGTVLLASLCENIGLEPLIILIPNHAFLGVRLAPNSNQTLFIETTALGFNIKDNINSLSTAFGFALNKGSEEYSDVIQKNPNSMIILDIKKLRAMGVYPLK